MVVIFYIFHVQPHFDLNRTTVLLICQLFKASVYIENMGAILLW